MKFIDLLEVTAGNQQIYVYKNLKHGEAIIFYEGEVKYCFGVDLATCENKTVLHIQTDEEDNSIMVCVD